MVLTTFDRSRLVYDALTAGANGFLLKGAPTVQLVGGVRAAARDEELLAPSIPPADRGVHPGVRRRPREATRC